MEDLEFQDYLMSRFFTNLSPLDKAVVLLLAGDLEISTSSLYEKLRKQNIHLSLQQLTDMIDRLIIASVFSKTMNGVSQVYRPLFFSGSFPGH